MISTLVFSFISFVSIHSFRMSNVLVLELNEGMSQSEIIQTSHILSKVRTVRRVMSVDQFAALYPPVPLSEQVQPLLEMRLDDVPESLRPLITPQQQNDHDHSTDPPFSQSKQAQKKRMKVSQMMMNNTPNPHMNDVFFPVGHCLSSIGSNHHLHPSVPVYPIFHNSVLNRPLESLEPYSMNSDFTEKKQPSQKKTLKRIDPYPSHEDINPLTSRGGQLESVLMEDEERMMESVNQKDEDLQKLIDMKKLCPEPTSVACAKCDRSIARRRLIYHSESHARLPRFRCSICDYTCWQRGAVLTHSKMTHEDKDGVNVVDDWNEEFHNTLQDFVEECFPGRNLTIQRRKKRVVRENSVNKEEKEGEGRISEGEDQESPSTVSTKSVPLNQQQPSVDTEDDDDVVILSSAYEMVPPVPRKTPDDEIQVVMVKENFVPSVIPLPANNEHSVIKRRRKFSYSDDSC